MCIVALACGKAREAKDSRCPDGATLVGHAPPKGNAQWCETKAKDGTAQRHGIYRAWHDNGQLQARVAYQNGLEHGSTESWYDDGQPLGKGVFKQGKPHGTMTTWHPNGHKQSEKRYEDGLKHGLARFWDDTGRLSAETHYANDEEQRTKLYDSDGNH